MRTFRRGYYIGAGVAITVAALAVVAFSTPAQVSAGFNQPFDLTPATPLAYSILSRPITEGNAAAIHSVTIDWDQPATAGEVVDGVQCRLCETETISDLESDCPSVWALNGGVAATPTTASYQFDPPIYTIPRNGVTNRRIVTVACMEYGATTPVRVTLRGEAFAN